MQLQTGVQQVLVQLTDCINGLSEEQYAEPLEILSDASIGQHVRHIIELFLCLEQGYAIGTVNYEKRKRDKKIETDKEFACRLTREIYWSLNKPNKALLLEAGFDEESEDLVSLHTNYYREIAFNLEHMIHHMALIRIGIRALGTDHLPEGFGVAKATIKYRKNQIITS